VAVTVFSGAYHPPSHTNTAGLFAMSMLSELTSDFHTELVIPSLSCSLVFFLDHPCCFVFFFFQAEDGIRDRNVTGVQTCALPISASHRIFPQLQDLCFHSVLIQLFCHLAQRGKGTARLMGTSV